MEKRDTTLHNASKDGTSQRVYLAVGGTAYHSCTAKEKARPTGKESRKERAPRASAKAKTRATVLGCTVRSLLTCWKDATQTPKPRGRTLGTIKRTSGNTLACWVRSRRSSQRRTVSGPRYNFNELSSDNEESQKQVDPCCSKDHSIACEDRRVTVDIHDLIKHSTKKSGKCPKTLREDGSRNLRGCNMKSQTRRKGVGTLKDVDVLDAIIEEYRKISALTKITECISPCTKTKLGWKRVSMAVDSGACENVIDAEEMVPGFEIKQTKASMSGVKYASASGEEILNLGEVVLPVITAETKRRMKL